MHLLVSSFGRELDELKAQLAAAELQFARTREAVEPLPEIVEQLQQQLAEKTLKYARAMKLGELTSSEDRGSTSQ